MAERQEIKQNLREYLPKKNGSQNGLSQLDVVLTTFSYFSSEKSDDRNFLRKFDWNYVSLSFTHYFFCLYFLLRNDEYTQPKSTLIISHRWL